MLLSYLAQGGKRRSTGIREHNIKLAFLPLDLSEEAIQIAKVRHVALDAGDIASDLLYRRRQLRLTAARYEDVGAFAHKLLSRGKADAAVATSYECNFSFKFVHIFPHFITVSDGEDDPAERAALNQVTQSISRFGQREGLGQDRFDRYGLKRCL